MRVFQRVNIEMRDQKLVQFSGFQGSPEDRDVNPDCEKGSCGLHLEAIKKEAVADWEARVVDLGARAQEEGWEGDGQDFDVYEGGDHECRDGVVGC